MQKATRILLCVNVALAAVLLALVLATVEAAAGITLGEGVVLQQHSLPAGQLSHGAPAPSARRFGILQPGDSSYRRATSRRRQPKMQTNPLVDLRLRRFCDLYVL
jgi:hypothetical protein